MNFSVTAAAYRQFHDDLLIPRRVVDEQLQPWERWEIATAGHSPALVDASLPRQSDEDLLEIGRKLSELLDLIDSTWAIRD
jgi:hypothetical protein